MGDNLFGGMDLIPYLCILNQSTMTVLLLLFLMFILFMAYEYFRDPNSIDPRDGWDYMEHRMYGDDKRK